MILYRDTFRPYGAPNSVLNSDGHKSSSVIYVARARDQKGLSIRDHLLSGGVSPNDLAYELDTFSSAQEFALAGLGIAILPNRLAQCRLRDGKLKPAQLVNLPMQGFGEHRICASYLEENRTDPRIKTVLKHLRNFDANNS